MTKRKKRIPISAAALIAREYGYDQVVIYARAVGEGAEGGEHLTSYGVNRAHCRSAALQVEAMKRMFGWEIDDHTK